MKKHLKVYLLLSSATILMLSLLHMVPSLYPALTLPSKNHSLAVSFGEGRLGNQMSSFATLLAFKKLHKIEPLLKRDQARMLLFYFKPKIKIPILEDELPEWRRYKWSIPFPIIDQKLWNYNYSRLSEVPCEMCKGHTIDFARYPNEIATFIKFLPELKRNYFTLKYKFLNNAEEKKNVVREKYLAKNGLHKDTKLTFVGIHVRRGDYAKHLSKLYNTTLVEKEYFAAAMDLFRQQEEHPVFVIVSNDMDWSEENIGVNKSDCFFMGSLYGKNETVNGTGTASDIGEDLALLSLMDRFVLTYGTYGLWAAFLAFAEDMEVSVATEDIRVLMPRGYEVIPRMKEIQKSYLSGWKVV